MHIGIICGEFPPVGGGVAAHVYNISEKLARRGHEVTVITRGSWGKTYHTRVGNVDVYRVRFLPLYPFHLQPHGLFVNQLLSSLESNFEVLHLHSPLIPVIRTTLPVVVTEHGTVKGFIDNLDLIDLYSLVEKIFRKMYVSIDRKIVERADRVIAVSNACAQELREWYGLKKDIEVIYNGVDTTFFIPGNSNRDETYILYSGALITKKGLPDLIRSATYICQEYPDMKFVLAGDGPLEKQLKGLVHQLGLDNNFSFVGYIDRDELLAYYQNATICVLPSYHEGLPTVLLEAMSCGIPTVATSVAGNSEVVKDGETGFLVPPKEPKRLAEAILTLLGDQKLRQEMGKNARKQAEESYDWEVIISKIEECYSSVLSETR